MFEDMFPSGAHAVTFSPPAPPAFADCTPRQKAARVLSDVLAPANLVVVLLLLVGWRGTTSWSGLGWGLLAALFCGVAPIGIIALGVRRGALTDQHIRVRRQRVVPMALSLVSVVAGITLLHVLGAPGTSSRWSSRCSWASCRPCWSRSGGRYPSTCRWPAAP
ncbi:hypothetical protein WKI68_16790 [Streptomyces sp. MS1.HAVA.3]|uniref:Uncharacterized protein n=1 Tax=Streptomyces caledonius TaxID=3134107 RepID=A0ABU8U417_9ACTN